MTHIIVTVDVERNVEKVIEVLEAMGRVERFSHLPRVLNLYSDLDEAEIMWTLSGTDHVSGAINGENEVKPDALNYEWIREGRMFSDKLGALRVKATLDADSGVFNPWWQQPAFFKWRYDSDRLGQDAIIAIVDGGIRVGHPDFAKNPSRITRIFNSFSTQGASNHGTACASVAAGDIVGIAPLAELLDVKVFPDDGGSTSTANIVNGLNAIIAWHDNPVNNPTGKALIVNCSFGSSGNGLSNPYGTVIDDMHNKGIIVFIAAGNDGQDLDTGFNAWPAEVTNYAVGAIKYDGRRAEFSNFGSKIKFYGFGHRVIGAGYPDGLKFSDISGTSFACPYLCGCLATWISGKWVPENGEQLISLMTEYEAFCSEGIYGDSVRHPWTGAKIPGAVIGRASYFPVEPGIVVTPQVNAITKFGTPEVGVMAWKARGVARFGGVPQGVGAPQLSGIALFEGPFFPASGLNGPFLDPLLTPTGWLTENDRVRNYSGVDSANEFAATEDPAGGQSYWEVEFKGDATGSWVGITDAANLVNFDDATAGTGLQDDGIGWRADGTLHLNGAAQAPLPTFAQGDRLMFAFDSSTGELWLGMNGTWFDDPTVDPATVTAVSLTTPHPAINVNLNGSSCQLYGSFRDQRFSVAGFTSLEFGAETPWLLDTSYARSGHTISEGDTRVDNTSGGSNFRWWVPTLKRISASQPDRVYWEVLMTTGAATYDGYHGIVTPTAITNIATVQTNPTEHGSTGRRGTGVIWASETGSSSQKVSGLQTFGTGKRLMMLFEPTTGQIWTGVDGTWDNDPSGVPNYSVYRTGISEWGLALHGRNLGDGMKLLSLSADFLYPIPSGAVSLGSLP